MKAESAKIRSKIKFTTMKSILLPIIIIVFLMKMVSHKNIKVNQAHAKLDTIYVGLPSHYDTVDIRFMNSNMTSIVVDKWHAKDFLASGAVSFDVYRESDFKFFSREVPISIKKHTIGISQLSDSLTLSRQDFFKRHTFFVIVSRQDTCFFYKATGNYMDKNFENEVHYDSAKSSRPSS
jgi:hypothetical protein